MDLENSLNRLTEAADRRMGVAPISPAEVAPT